MKAKVNVGSGNKQYGPDDTCQIQIGIWPVVIIVSLIALVIFWWLS